MTTDTRQSRSASPRLRPAEIEHSIDQLEFLGDADSDTPEGQIMLKAAKHLRETFDMARKVSGLRNALNGARSAVLYLSTVTGSTDAKKVATRSMAAIDKALTP